MSCRNDVSEFIKRYGISARVEKFDIEVSTVRGAVKATGSPPSEIVKTLVVRVDDGYAAVVLTGDRKVDLSKIAKVLKSRTSRLASYDEVKEVTGFEVGGVSPLSDCVKSLRVIFDCKVLEKNWVWCGGGDLSTLAYVSVQDLRRVLQPIIADVSRD